MGWRGLGETEGHPRRGVVGVRPRRRRVPPPRLPATPPHPRASSRWGWMGCKRGRRRRRGGGGTWATSPARSSRTPSACDFAVWAGKNWRKFLRFCALVTAVSLTRPPARWGEDLALGRETSLLAGMLWCRYREPQSAQSAKLSQSEPRQVCAAGPKHSNKRGGVRGEGERGGKGGSSGRAGCAGGRWTKSKNGLVGGELPARGRAGRLIHGRRVVVAWGGGKG